MKQKTKDTFERIVLPTILAIALVGVAFWGSEQSALAEEYKNSTTAMYTRAFTELCDNMNNLETALGKLRVTASPAQYVLLLDDVWRLSGASVSLMSQIPSSHIDTADLNSFVVRLGDYAHGLTKKAVRGTPMTEEDQAQLAELHNACIRIGAELNERLAVGDVPVAVITNDGYFTSEASEASDAASGEGEGSGQYQEQEGIEEFPTLIYDGPFSESTEKQEARGLTGNPVSEEEARAVAAKVAGLSEIEPQGTSDGMIPAYDFHGTYEDGREVDVSITQTGGHLLWMMSSATGGAEGVPEEAETERFRQAAEQYLAENGYADMRATYAQYYGGCALINFAATQGEVILYSDLVKIWVDRETCGVVGVDARNYLFSHMEREFAEPAISMEEAESMVSTNLTVEDRALALIPITPQTERLCYEFKGTCGEEEYIVYISTETGEEEQIFRIINTEDGQLVL